MRYLSLLLLTALFLPMQANAFDPNYLLSDWELEDSFSLDFNQIQHFLNRGALADYKTEDWKGVTRYATDIIWRAAQEHKISPKFLLVLLQKEQSLIEDDNPTDSQLDWATGYAVCDSCAKDDPAIQRWKGFGKQVNSAAAQFREGYLADIEEDGVINGTYGPGKPVTVSGETVVPANAATAALYAYTPHLHGNRLFTTIWDRWFATQYPTGSLLQADGQPGVYYIEYGYKRPIHSWSALLSRFNPDLIITVNPNVLANYPEGRPIDFPNYSLLQDEDGTIYLLVDDTLRPIDSLETFRSLGFMEDELVSIDNADLDYYDIGEPITGQTRQPKGIVYKLSTSGTHYFIENGKRHILLDPALLSMRFASTTVKTVAPVEVEQFQEASPILIPDGHLVRSEDEPTVYVIAEKERLPIDSETTFQSYGWSFDDVHVVSESLLRQHRLGDPIEAIN